MKQEQQSSKDSKENDNTSHNPKTSPLQSAFFLSRFVTFWWLNPLFKIAQKRCLDQADLFPLADEDKASIISNKFQKIWQKELSNRYSKNVKPSLKLALFKCYIFNFMLVGIPGLLTECFAITQPIFIGRLVAYFSDQETEIRTNAYLYAMGIGISAIMAVFFQQIFHFGAYRVGWQIRIALSAAVYDKTLKLNSAGISKIGTGHIVNLLANDVQRFNDIMTYLHYIWISPLEIICLWVLLWIQIGPASTGAIVGLLFLLAFQGVFAKLHVKFRENYLSHADDRVKIMSEVISGMRMLKMYAWEKSFCDAIENLRRKEVSQVLRAACIQATNMAMYFTSTSFVTFVCLILYVLLGNPLNPPIVFTVFSLLSAVQTTIMIGIPESIHALVDGVVTVRRLENFLLMEDHCEDETSLDVPDDFAIVTFDISHENDEDHENDENDSSNENDIVKIRDDSAASSRTVSRPLSTIDIRGLDGESSDDSDTICMSVQTSPQKSPKLVRTASTSTVVDDNSCLVVEGRTAAAIVALPNKKKRTPSRQLSDAEYSDRIIQTLKRIQSEQAAARSIMNRRRSSDAGILTNPIIAGLGSNKNEKVYRTMSMIESTENRYASSFDNVGKNNNESAESKDNDCNDDDTKNYRRGKRPSVTFFIDEEDESYQNEDTTDVSRINSPKSLPKSQESNHQINHGHDDSGISSTGAKTTMPKRSSLKKKVLNTHVENIETNDFPTITDSDNINDDLSTVPTPPSVVLSQNNSQNEPIHQQETIAPSTSGEEGNKRGISLTEAINMAFSNQATNETTSKSSSSVTTEDPPQKHAKRVTLKARRRNALSKDDRKIFEFNATKRNRAKADEMATNSIKKAGNQIPQQGDRANCDTVPNSTSIHQDIASPRILRIRKKRIDKKYQLISENGVQILNYKPYSNDDNNIENITQNGSHINQNYQSEVNQNNLHPTLTNNDGESKVTGKKEEFLPRQVHVNKNFQPEQNMEEDTNFDINTESLHDHSDENSATEPAVHKAEKLKVRDDISDELHAQPDTATGKSKIISEEQANKNLPTCSDDYKVVNNALNLPSNPNAMMEQDLIPTVSAKELADEDLHSSSLHGISLEVPADTNENAIHEPPISNIHSERINSMGGNGDPSDLIKENIRDKNDEITALPEGESLEPKGKENNLHSMLLVPEDKPSRMVENNSNDILAWPNCNTLKGIKEEIISNGILAIPANESAKTNKKENSLDNMLALPSNELLNRVEKENNFNDKLVLRKYKSLERADEEINSSNVLPIPTNESSKSVVEKRNSDNLLSLPENENLKRMEKENKFGSILALPNGEISKKIEQEGSVHDQAESCNEQKLKVQESLNQSEIDNTNTLPSRTTNETASEEKAVLRKERKESTNPLMRRPAFRDAASSSKKTLPLLNVADTLKLPTEIEMEEYRLWQNTDVDVDTEKNQPDSSNFQALQRVRRMLRNNVYNTNAPTQWGQDDRKTRRNTITSEINDTPKSRIRSVSSVTCVGDDCKLLAEGISAGWGGDLSLQDINFSVQGNELCIVVGSVGSGKSTLLMALMGEIPLENGQIIYEGDIAYVPQTPWLVPGTIKDNILFGKPFDKEKYRKVIRVCTLDKDFHRLRLGDATHVGERDDPLSAVDPQVSRQLFERCICDLLGGRLRILVTHQIQYLKRADKILVLDNGKLQHYGTYEELVGKGIDFLSYVKTDEEDKQTESLSVSNLTVPTRERRYTISARHMTGITNNEPPQESVQTEDRIEGVVPLTTYYFFFKAGFGLATLIMFILICAISQTSTIFCDWWLSQLSDQFTRLPDNLTNAEKIASVTLFDLHIGSIIGIYSALLICSLLLALGRCLMSTTTTVNAAKSFHDKMLQSVVQTRMQFYDTNPAGRIINRFSKDAAAMDDKIPVSFLGATQCFVVCIGVIITTAIVNPWVLIPAVVLTVVFIFLRKFYLNLSRDIKRLESINNSPIYDHLSITLQGLPIIRAFNAEKRFQDNFLDYMNVHTQTWIVFAGSMRWIAFHLDLVSSLYIGGVAFASLIVSDHIDPGLIGLSLSYSLILLGNLQWSIRQSVELENQMTSVERIREYIKLPSEGDLETSKDPSASWPEYGNIIYDNLSFGHGKNLPNVLKNISCTILGQEKIGIVGRTGAGKSSFIAALFRISEPEGSLIIDGVDCKKIGLHCLRSRISVIPQEPVFFTGTIRTNLDPGNRYSDEQLWDALEEVHMKEFISTLPGNVHALVTEAGSNFSNGQKQLLCLARAILKRNRILVIDEATANVDFRTDSIIQDSIRRKFKECTVITIAHRLNTVIDSDRIMVLDDGRIAEFAAPFALLLREDSLFSKLIQQTDKCELEYLIGQARKSYHERHRKSVGAFMPMIMDDLNKSQKGVIAKENFVIKDYSGNNVSFTVSIEDC
ncbi:uncharacterized protein TRIADDRAFT_54969 [Trichoplax adhaerens]|uniref:Uncharacterized protein n=1 Tax=Trichoplax adhaerens TaxID=10228 RepID=B3RQF5_TRIAD|nr:hypothetical protein TRIADDRAFT_54969 [Trichoplax adhaerens]EDV27231.1 hypothetical protein TRIADDRAFT_54969 [Trichoplax adhaerens]|eukprot:XP_002111227.1 hypothetical protein TRIADDRAFT_54969 [Trichoplax adhaerens]